MKPSVNIIVAIDRRGAIGIGGDLVYRFKEDLRHFKTATMGSTVVMGRRTWQSLPGALPGRRNIVVSATEGFSTEGAEVAKSLEEALAMAADGPGDTYIIGGAMLYEAALPLADRLVLTEIDDCRPADTFFPQFDRSEYTEESSVQAESFNGRFVVLARR